MHSNLTPKIQPRIFITDDDCDDADILMDVLKEINPQFIVWCFDDPTKAYEFIINLSDEELPSLIILDYNIPAESCLSILKKFKEINRFENIPKVIYSGHLSPVEVKLCKEAGATICMTKSAQLSDVKNDVLTMLDLFLKKGISSY